MATQVEMLNPSPSRAIADYGHLLAPLVIGITGHRDIWEGDRPRLVASVKKVFTDLRRKYPSTPLIVLSALADGADRLAAHVALSPEIEARLFVPLPLPQGLYEKDFDAESLKDFRTLLRSADGVFEVPLAAGCTLTDIAQDGPQRDLQYQRAGEYIVRRCQILIALWDGEKTGLAGGTATIVDFKMGGLPLSDAYSFEALESFPVYQVVTPRKKNTQVQGAAFAVHELYPQSFMGDTAKARQYYDHMFLRIEEYNRYAANANSGLRAAMIKSKAALLQGLSELQLGQESRRELDRYSLADVLAVRFHKQKVTFDIQLHTSVFLALFLFAVYAHVSHHPFFLVLALGLVFAGSVRHAGFQERGGDTKSEDYRAMAEGLRVRFFWTLAGLADSVTDYYFGKQRTELDWIRNCFRAWDVPMDLRVADCDAVERWIDTVRTHWVEDQRAYFRVAQARDQRRLELIEFYGKVLTRFAVCAGVIMLGVTIFQHRSEWLKGEFFGHYEELLNGLPIVAIEASLAAAALLHNYGNRMAFREHTKQYVRMESVFSRAVEILTTTKDDPERSMQFIRWLGREALGENGDWVLLHRERPLEVPHP